MKRKEVRAIAIVECPYCDARNAMVDIINGKCWECGAKIVMTFTQEEDE